MTSKPRRPRIISSYMHAHEETETDVLAYLERQYTAWQKLENKATDFAGWVALKLSCSRRQAETVVQWMGSKREE